MISGDQFLEMPSVFEATDISNLVALQLLNILNFRKF
jgi:hypothetical protein